MPTYEYNCIECETAQEVTRGIKEEESAPPCPKCGYRMSKVYSSFGINLKGSGFYSTDNRRGK